MVDGAAVFGSEALTNAKGSISKTNESGRFKGFQIIKVIVEISCFYSL